jgi:hypothetical protein
MLLPKLKGVVCKQKSRHEMGRNLGGKRFLISASKSAHDYGVQIFPFPLGSKRLGKYLKIANHAMPWTVSALSSLGK